MEVLEDRMLLTGPFTSDDIIVRSGDTAPEVDTGNANGMFSRFSRGPIINESGRVLFQAEVSGSHTSSDTGLFQASSTETITAIAREKQDIPAIAEGTLYRGLTKSVSDIPLPFNENGQAVFSDRISGVHYTENTSIFSGSSDDGLILIAREGSSAPGAMNGSHNGKFYDMENTYVTINNSGQIGFEANLYDTNNGSADDQAIFITDADGNLIQIAREGETIPGSLTDTFTSVLAPSINDAGQVAFWGLTLNASIPDGIYVSNGDGTPLRVVMQEGQAFGAVGDKLRTNGLISASLINESGDVAFRSHVDDGDAGTIVRSVFVRSGNGDLREVARSGDILPNGETYYDSGLPDLVLNNQGDAAFTAKDELNNIGIYRSDANAVRRGDLKEIVKYGQRVPAGDAAFNISQNTEFTLNDSRQMAFRVTLNLDAGGTASALFFYDDVHGLNEIVRVGDELEGSTISEIYFAGNDTHQFLENNGDGLNNKGHVTFSYEIENGSQGVAIVDMDLAERVDVRVVTTPTIIDANGEISSLPGNQNWISEWSTYWVEIWVSTGKNISEGVFSVNLDFSYVTEYTSATTIEFGSSFTQNQTGTINDASGVVENLYAETAVTNLGIRNHLLFARIQFDSFPDDQVSLDLPGQSIGPYDLGFQVNSPQVDLVADVPVETTVGQFDGASIWANPYDLNDDDTISFRDLILFASVYGSIPSESNSDYAWFADLNQNNRVEFRDLILFASNYGKRKVGHSDISYPQNYPEAWGNRLMVEAQQQPKSNVKSLTQSAVETILESSIEQVSPQLTLSERTVLDHVDIEVVNLNGATLGRAVPGTIYIDVNAAGYGWFIDVTPFDNSEFEVESQLTLIALPDSAAAGRVDLLSVIKHELGHLLGYEHEDTGLMKESLIPGVRKSSSWEEKTDLFFSSLENESELVPF